MTGAVPVPDKAITSGEFVALLVTVMLPLALPTDDGANVTLQEVDCPAARLKGKPMEQMLKPAPLGVTCEIVTLEFPELVSVTLCVALVPVVRLPKLNDVGFAESCKVAATPVPLSAMLVGELGALLVSAMLPEKLPAEAGANPTLKEALLPGAIDRGKDSPDKVNPVPVRGAWVTLRVAEPGFWTVMVCVFVTPVITLPKLTLDGTTEIDGCTPVPLSEIVVGELVAVLTTLMLPETLPAAVGAKLTLRERL